MDDFDQFLRRLPVRVIDRRGGIDHMLSDVIFDDLADKPFQGAAT